MVSDDIIVFAGHYFKDPGCVIDGITEHTYTKIVAQKTVDLAQAESLPVIHGIDSQLWHKIDWVNMRHHASVGVIEIHFNCANNIDAQGTEVLYHSGSYYGKLLASCIYRQLIQILWKPDIAQVKQRGVKTDKDLGRHLGFLSHTTPPAVITESLFLSNQQERDMLVTDEVQDKIAAAHVAGIRDYLLLRGGSVNYY